MTYIKCDPRLRKYANKTITNFQNDRCGMGMQEENFCFGDAYRRRLKQLDCKAKLEENAVAAPLVPVVEKENKNQLQANNSRSVVKSQKIIRRRNTVADLVVSGIYY